ncbi:hypothetical protein ACLOJK_006893 [Asimina triloba]
MGVAHVSKEECLVIILSATLSVAQSRAKNELEALLEQRHVEGVAEGERHFFYELEGMGDPTEVLPQDLYAAQLEQERMEEDAVGLLLDFVVVRAERDEVVNSAEATRPEASGLSIELIASKFETEALCAHGIDLDVEKVESHIELEVVRGEVSLLRVRVALLKSRELELLFELEVAWAEVALLRAKLEASDVYLRQEKYKCSHYSQSGYVRALSDVAVLFSSIDL